MDLTPDTRTPGLIRKSAQRFASAWLFCACCLSAAPAVTDSASLANQLLPIRAETVDGRFFALLDLGTPGLEATRALVEEGKYAEALEAWRDYVVLKLRRRKIGQLPWHSNLRHPKRVAWAKRLMGDTSAVELNDVFGMTGPPGQGRRIDWLTKKDHGVLKWYYGFNTFTPLVAAYQQERDPAYLEKWFEIADAFVVEQKRAEESLPVEQRKGMIVCWDVRSHAVTLGAAGRAHNLIKAIACFAKALPDGHEARDWFKEAMLPIDTPLSPGASAMIPAGSLADIAISLYADHRPLLLKAYRKVGRTPNQRFTGLTALATTAYVFDEFRAGAELMAIAGAALEDYVRTTVLPDGGDLEQSFNYNLGFIREGREAVEIFSEGPERPRWVGVLHDAMLRRERLFAGCTMPLGNLPRTGTHAGIPPAAVWRDGKTLAGWQKRMAKTVAGISEAPMARRVYNHLFGPGDLEPPPFTSVAFPYSGYYALRNGWDMTSLYLWLIGSRKGSGHCKENINGIAVTAYGRDLIVDGGPPPYTPNFLPESQRDAYHEIREYFGEKSSRTSNTVLVDMQSQRRHLVPGPRRAYQTPIPSRWHASDALDLAESRYEDGYGKGGWASEAAIEVKHSRQVLFLRRHALWLVVDRLTGDGKPHEYQQQWHFPPPHFQWNVHSPGFLDEQVLADGEAHVIRTADPDGPNIVLRHFSPSPIDYRRYFGHKDPWLGWFARGIGGERIPSVDVHACWRSSDDTIVVTALVPSPDDQDLVQQATNRSRADGTVAGCRLRLTSGTDVTWLAARAPAPLQIGKLAATAEGLLLVKTPAEASMGIALGVQTISLAGQAQTPAPPDFEFTVERGALRIVSAIEYPATPDTVTLRPDHGLFVGPVTVEVALPGRPGAEIRYTLDGTVPTADSPRCTGLITIASAAPLTVRPFRHGQPSGEPVRRRFEIRALPPVPPLPQVHLSDLKPTTTTMDAFALTRDRCCYKDLPLRLGGQAYERGIGTHANALIVYPCKPTYRRFVATVGLDDVTAQRGNIIFRVLADGRLLTESPLLEGATQRFWHLDCPIPDGARELQLKVDDGPHGGGWGMGDWVNAGFVTRAE